ncbi:MAG TPA: alpha-amylase family protein [Herpetosiphonaceae bacterium]
MGMSDRWYENAIIYCLDVDTFQDSDGDGDGDFAGLTKRLDYLAGLGVTCIWLLPFYPSPNRDNGYDVTEYYGVDPRLGTLGDFVEFMREARERGMRVIVDLVVNHTSDQHPWFQAACRDKRSPFRDFYVWSEEKPADAHEGVVFPGKQDAVWTYSEEAGAYYFHRFYEHQPDLNINNPAVRAEIFKIMGFWAELGVSGFRVDAAPFLIELKGIDDPEIDDPYLYLKEMHEFLTARRGDAILLAEANVSPDKIAAYFGDGDKMHMLFNFLVNQPLFLALAREQAAPLIKALDALPEIPTWGQWANFLRNHDELDLGRLSDAERGEVFKQFGPEEHMQLYERGIRRRLAPMLGGDQARLALAYSLLFTLPGTPVLRYGEEIGMGDDLSLEERESVRTPMQWSPEENGGFSKAPRKKLVRPVISGGSYGYQRVNVAAQSRDPRSLLNTIERMIRTRKVCPEFGWGQAQIMDTGEASVFAHRCEWDGGIVLAVHNLSSKACPVTLDLSEYEAGHLVDLLGDREYRRFDGGKHQIELEGYGYRWFRVDDIRQASQESERMEARKQGNKGTRE